MTGSMVVSAFVNTQPIVRQAALSQALLQAPSSTAVAFYSAASTALNVHVLNPAATAACVSFFEGFKTPATLIAGSCIANLFTMTTEVKETYGMSKMKIVLLRVYHVLSLLSVCLSLTSVVTSQAGTALLLVNENQHVVASKSIDAYTFLRTHMNFEFIMTRWCFIMSILLFLLSTTVRMIVEFGLFTRTRRLAGTMVVSMMASVISFLLSYVNTSQVATWPNLWCMTKEVALVSLSLCLSLINIVFFPLLFVLFRISTNACSPLILFVLALLRPPMLHRIAIV
jgi:hypothetical protein